MSLAAAMARKWTATAPKPANREQTFGEIKPLKLRLRDPVNDQPHEISFASRRSQHAWLAEALNLLFEKNGKPTIAPVTAGANEGDAASPLSVCPGL